MLVETMLGMSVNEAMDTYAGNCCPDQSTDSQTDDKLAKEFMCRRLLYQCEQSGNEIESMETFRDVMNEWERRELQATKLNGPPNNQIIAALDNCYNPTFTVPPEWAAGTDRFKTMMKHIASELVDYKPVRKLASDNEMARCYREMHFLGSDSMSIALRRLRRVQEDHPAEVKQLVKDLYETSPGADTRRVAQNVIVDFWSRELCPILHLAAREEFATVYLSFPEGKQSKTIDVSMPTTRYFVQRGDYTEIMMIQRIKVIQNYTLRKQAARILLRCLKGYGKQTNPDDMAMIGHAVMPTLRPQTCESFERYNDAWAHMCPLGPDARIKDATSLTFKSVDWDSIRRKCGIGYKNQSETQYPTINPTAVYDDGTVGFAIRPDISVDEMNLYESSIVVLLAHVRGTTMLMDSLWVVNYRKHRGDDIKVIDMPIIELMRVAMKYIDDETFNESQTRHMRLVLFILTLYVRISEDPSNVAQMDGVFRDGGDTMRSTGHFSTPLHGILIEIEKKMQQEKAMWIHAQVTARNPEMLNRKVAEGILKMQENDPSYDDYMLDNAMDQILREPLCLDGLFTPSKPGCAEYPEYLSGMSACLVVAMPHGTCTTNCAD
jgi:hypothetical protein